MSKTTIKLTISIDQQRIGYYGRGEMTITDIMFSESNYKLMDSDELITEVKQCIKAMKGWSMITITLTDDIQFAVYPRIVNEVRFTNSYGDIKMSYSNGKYFDNFNEAKIKELYENIRVFVKNANIFQLGKLKQSASTEVATA
jgi:ABC-type polar amino acid transport system ATPase subunit